MPAGDFARAKLRFGDQTSKILDDIQNIFRDVEEKRRQREALSNLNTLVQQFNNRVGDIGNAVNTTTETRPNPLQKMDINPLDRVGLGNKDTSSLANLLPQKPVGLPAYNANTMLKGYINEPTYQRTTSTPISQEEKYNRAQDEVGNFLTQVMTSPTTKYINPNVLSTLQAYVDQRAGRLKPEPLTEVNLPKGAKVLLRDKSGKIVQEYKNPEMAKPENPTETYRATGRKRITNGLSELEYEQGQIVNGKFIPVVDNEGKSVTKWERNAIPGWGTGGSDKEDKYGKLPQSTIDAMVLAGNLPQYETNEDGAPLLDPKTQKQVPLKETTKNYLIDKAKESLKNDLVKSPSAINWLSEIQDRWGRELSPKELKEEVNKHLGYKTLLPKDAIEIRTLANRYIKLYNDLKKNTQVGSNPATPPIMNKEDFIKDFQKEEGREPTDQELETLRQRGLWK